MNARERVGIGGRVSSERLASRERVGGETRGYYDYAPGAAYVRVAGGDIEWCPMHFRSFDLATDTYMGFDGTVIPVRKTDGPLLKSRSVAGGLRYLTRPSD